MDSHALLIGEPALADSARADSAHAETAFMDSAHATPSGAGRVGELLAFRPRRSTVSEGKAVAAGAGGVAGAVVSPDPALEMTVIRYGGHEFVARRSMAEIFMSRACSIIQSHGSELVPLLHSGGIELLHITSTTPLDARS